MRQPASGAPGTTPLEPHRRPPPAAVRRSVRQPAAPSLLEVVAAQCAAPAPGFCETITAALRETYGAGLQGVLFYGSCLREAPGENSIVDVYVIVDDYDKAYEKRWLARANAWLPPNVFYRELPGAGAAPLRVKAAVISLADFRAGIKDWFHSYLWGRFAQPARLLYARDPAAERELHQLLTHAVLTLLKTSIPMLPRKRNSVEAVWTQALSLSYAAELRPEPVERVARLVCANLPDYARLLAAALPLLGDMLCRGDHDDYLCLCRDKDRNKARLRWRLRRLQGRVLSMLRLIKALLTFSNGVDYAVWKISRHTGVDLQLTPRQRRYPLLFGWRVFRRLVKRGVLR